MRLEEVVVVVVVVVVAVMVEEVGCRDAGAVLVVVVVAGMVEERRFLLEPEGDVVRRYRPSKPVFQSLRWAM